MSDKRAKDTGGPDRVPKLCGADTELGNFIQGGDFGGRDTSYQASRLLLREVEGLPQFSRRHSAQCRCAFCNAERPTYASNDNGGSSGLYDGYGWSGGAPVQQIVYDPQDWGRKFGAWGCTYIDLDHWEHAQNETLRARDHVASWHAMLRLARRTLTAANARLDRGRRIRVLANNSDGWGHNSWGGHLNFLVTRTCWDNLFHRKLHQLLYLASYQVSSIVLTGQGKVGSENGQPATRYQLSQRADFCERLVGIQTTYNRPIVNSRDEALCGSAPGLRSAERESDLARLHVIFYDTNLSHVSCFLKVGMMQIVLAMIEAGSIRPDLVLDDPLAALVQWSHDPDLTATAATAAGKQLTAVELQSEFLSEARRFVEWGGCEGIVPEAGTIIAMWEETLDLLAARDMTALARRLDWALKLSVLLRAMEQTPGLEWDSPQIKHLDHLYSSLDASEGLYWAYERAGATMPVASEERIETLMEHPPEDTRAWTRAMLLRVAGPERVDDVDWDRIRFRIGGSGWRTRYRTVYLPNPLGHTRKVMESVFEGNPSLEEILDGVENAAGVVDTTVVDADSETLAPDTKRKSENEE
jgi:proteasome accessory factor A